jgi:hypothetical protein
VIDASRDPVESESLLADIAAADERDRSHRATVEGNARLTAMTAVVLFVLLGVEGVTILGIHSLLTPHVFIGMLLVPPVLVKMGTTTWRFWRYYRGDPAYRRKGPPPPVLRLLGPALVLLTIAVFATGIGLVLGPAAWRQNLVFLHKATFIAWIVAMVVHVLGHLVETARLAPRDFLDSSRRQVAGAGVRQWTLALALVSGLLLAMVVVPHVGAWWHTGGAGTR